MNESLTLGIITENNSRVFNNTGGNYIGNSYIEGINNGHEAKIKAY